jgi:hypothetical protein
MGPDSGLVISDDRGERLLDAVQLHVEFGVLGPDEVAEVVETLIDGGS